MKIVGLVAGITAAAFVATSAVAADFAPLQALAPGAEALATDETPRFTVFGRIPMDFVTYGDLVGAVPQAAPGNHYSIHNSRIGIEGYLSPVVFFRGELGFYQNPSSAALVVEDLYTELQGLGFVGNVRVGHFLEPFSLERLTRGENLTFMERSGATQNFAPERSLGVMIYNAIPGYENLSWYLGAFAGTYRNGPPGGWRNDWWTLTGNTNFTGRVAWAPVYSHSNGAIRLVHLGGGFTVRNTGTSPGGLGNGDWESKIPLGGFDSLLNIQLLPGMDIRIANIELAAVFGPLTLQAEHFEAWGELGGVAPPPPARVRGQYVQAALMFGGYRHYDMQSKSFSGVHIDNPMFDETGWAGGRGAFELAVRWDNTNLDVVDALLPGAGTPPTVIGTHRNWTVGFNWYLNDHHRIMIDWVNSDTFYTFIGNSTGNHFGIRYEVTFGLGE